MCSSERDSLFEAAARLMVEFQQGSTSLIQRKLLIGYLQASKIMDQLEAAGIVGPFSIPQGRKVLIDSKDALEELLVKLNPRNKDSEDVLPQAGKETIIQIENTSFEIIDGQLDLRLEGLEELPSSIGEFVDLKEINCQANNLKGLPESIGDLTNLSHLYLGHNLLTCIPDSIGKLNKLQILDLSHNQLTTLPKSLINLDRDAYILLNKNPIKELPGFFKEFTNLSGIDFSEISFLGKPANPCDAQSLMDILIELLSEQNYILSKDAGAAALAYFNYICNQQGTGSADIEFIQYLVNKGITIQEKRISRVTHLTSVEQRTIEKADFDEVFIELYK